VKGENEVQESTRKTLRNGTFRYPALQIVPLHQPDRILRLALPYLEEQNGSPIIGQVVEAIDVSWLPMARRGVR
jgi:hypothetical protein